VDFELVDRRQFQDVIAVAHELINTASVHPESILLVGARCRDLLHLAQGYTNPLRGTTDLDLGIAIRNVGEYKAVVSHFDKAGEAPARFTIAGFPVDVMPFGGIEAPRGQVRASERRADPPFSVEGFQAVLAASKRLDLGDGLAIQVPLPPGYVALKVHAFAERSLRHETKDAGDLAIALYWYRASSEVTDFLYQDAAGVPLLESADFNPDVASAALLGVRTREALPPSAVRRLTAAWDVCDPEIIAKAYRTARAPVGLRVGPGTTDSALDSVLAFGEALRP